RVGRAGNGVTTSVVTVGGKRPRWQGHCPPHSAARCPVHFPERCRARSPPRIRVDPHHPRTFPRHPTLRRSRSPDPPPRPHPLPVRVDGHSSFWDCWSPIRSSSWVPPACPVLPVGRRRAVARHADRVVAPATRISTSETNTAGRGTGYLYSRILSRRPIVADNAVTAERKTIPGRNRVRPDDAAPMG